MFITFHVAETDGKWRPCACSVGKPFCRFSARQKQKNPPRNVVNLLGGRCCECGPRDGTRSPGRRSAGVTGAPGLGGGAPASCRRGADHTTAFGGLGIYLGALVSLSLDSARRRRRRFGGCFDRMSHSRATHIIVLLRRLFSFVFLLLAESFRRFGSRMLNGKSSCSLSRESFIFDD